MPGPAAKVTDERIRERCQLADERGEPLQAVADDLHIALRILGKHRRRLGLSGRHNTAVRSAGQMRHSARDPHHSHEVLPSLGLKRRAELMADPAEARRLREANMRGGRAATATRDRRDPGWREQWGAVVRANQPKGEASSLAQLLDECIDAGGPYEQEAKRLREPLQRAIETGRGIKSAVAAVKVNRELVQVLYRLRGAHPRRAPIWHGDGRLRHWLCLEWARIVKDELPSLAHLMNPRRTTGGRPVEQVLGEEFRTGAGVVLLCAIVYLRLERGDKQRVVAQGFGWSVVSRHSRMVSAFSRLAHRLEAKEEFVDEWQAALLAADNRLS